MKSENIIFKSGITLVVSLLFFVNFAFAQKFTIDTGRWMGHLKLNDSTNLPFNFKIKNSNGKISMEIVNAEERIIVDEIVITTDSVFIKMPVFDSEFRIKMNGDSVMNGNWINYARKNHNVIPFEAKHGNYYLFYKESDYLKGINITGNWETTFSPNTKDMSKALGVFKMENIFLNGTFLTETGDYRFLQGEQCGLYKIALSCFDGAHAFLFTGEVKGDSIINGNYYSGAHWHENWVAVRNDKFELRNPDSLTYLKPGFTKIDFNFKNLEGKNVSLKDDKFKNKVVLIQIMGSWCPNCMDETKFLAPFYDQYKSKGLEIVGLAFERTDDFNKAVANVDRLKKRFNAHYEFLITMKTGAD
ncbi:MAG: TlpA disulfide reductase family protein, partial [Bacteroidia bacterium]